MMTDKDEAFDIVSKVDHRAYPVKHVMTKPKMSFWDIYKLKKILETGYERLEEEVKKDDKSIQKK